MAENTQELEKLKNATCLIQAVDGSNATGFHYGCGWIMTVAHIFQKDSDPEKFHSLLSGATFTFNVRGEEITFKADAKRLAFIHRLTPGEQVDQRNMDIAMVKLGKQYDDKVGANWENYEQRQLKELNLASFAKIQHRIVSVGDQVYTIYNKYDDQARVYIRKIAEQNVTAVKNGGVAIANGNDFPYIVLQPAISEENGGVPKSGAPILSKDHNLLVGLLYGSDDREDEALLWNNGILQYTAHGNTIAALTGRLECFLQRVKCLRNDLNQLASDNQLTIYACNGEKVTGTTTEQN